MTAELANPHTKRGPPLLLTALEGSNPLGFVAALGTLRVLSLDSVYPHARMSWVSRGSSWVPSLNVPDDQSLDPETLLDALDRILVREINEHPARLLQNLKTDDAKARRAVFAEATGDALKGVRIITDWLAALGSDAASADAVNQLQTTRRDYYFDNLASIMARTTTSHLRRSLFEPWDYADSLDNQSLHLDPSEDRRHAYQWNKPAGDPDRAKRGGMLGANRLAIEAIPFFTSFPAKDVLRTVGFTGNRSRDTRWTWPLWQTPLDMSCVQSLLSLSDLQRDSIDPKERNHLRERGIVAVFRSDRILVQKTPNFTPARRIA